MKAGFSKTAGIVIWALCVAAAGCNLSPVKYANHSSSDPALGVEMNYLAGWTVSEIRGNNNAYAQAVFLEPSRKGKKFKAAISLSVIDIARSRLDYNTLQDAVSDIVLLRQQLPEGKLLKQSRGTVAGEEAAFLVFGYKVPDALHGFDTPLMPVQEQAVLFMNDGKLVKVRYVNYDLDYLEFDQAFTRILTTVRFRKMS